MVQVRRAKVVLCAALIVLAMPVVLWAHGTAGKRFFPTTLKIDDPFVSDELSFGSVPKLLIAKFADQIHIGSRIIQ
jgi:hypothetical protein